MRYGVFCSNESIYTVGKLNDLQSASCLDHRRRDAAEERDLVTRRLKLDSVFGCITYPQNRCNSI